MYDLDNDGKISRDELLAILHMMVGANIRYDLFKQNLKENSLSNSNLSKVT